MSFNTAKYDVRCAYVPYHCGVSVLGKLFIAEGGGFCLRPNDGTRSTPSQQRVIYTICGPEYCWTVGPVR